MKGGLASGFLEPLSVSAHEVDTQSPHGTCGGYALIFQGKFDFVSPLLAIERYIIHK